MSEDTNATELDWNFALPELQVEQAGIEDEKLGTLSEVDIFVYNGGTFGVTPSYELQTVISGNSALEVLVGRHKVRLGRRLTKDPLIYEADIVSRSEQPTLDQIARARYTVLATAPGPTRFFQATAYFHVLNSYRPNNKEERNKQKLLITAHEILRNAEVECVEVTHEKRMRMAPVQPEESQRILAKILEKEPDYDPDFFEKRRKNHLVTWYKTNEREIPVMVTLCEQIPTQWKDKKGRLRQEHLTHLRWEVLKGCPAFPVTSYMHILSAYLKAHHKGEAFHLAVKDDRGLRMEESGFRNVGNLVYRKRRDTLPAHDRSIATLVAVELAREVIEVPFYRFKH
jgi:hypothetical protein